MRDWLTREQVEYIYKIRGVDTQDVIASFCRMALAALDAHTDHAAEVERLVEQHKTLQADFITQIDKAQQESLALAERVRVLEAQLAAQPDTRLMRALQRYADPNNWRRSGRGNWCEWTGKDNGRSLALQTLAALRAQQEGKWCGPCNADRRGRQSDLDHTCAERKRKEGKL